MCTSGAVYGDKDACLNLQLKGAYALCCITLFPVTKKIIIKFEQLPVCDLFVNYLICNERITYV